MALGLALAVDGQDAVAHFDVEILLGEAGDRQGDAVMILVGALDIVGRIARGAFGLIQKIKQAIEADGGTEKRGIIQTHDDNLLEALSPPPTDDGAGSGADSPPEQLLDRLQKNAFKTLEIAGNDPTPAPRTAPWRHI